MSVVSYEKSTSVLWSCESDKTLLCNVWPVQEAADLFYAQQMQMQKKSVEQQIIQAHLSRHCAPQEPLSVAEHCTTTHTKKTNITRSRDRRVQSCVFSSN